MRKSQSVASLLYWLHFSTEHLVSNIEGVQLTSTSHRWPEALFKVDNRKIGGKIHGRSCNMAYRYCVVSRPLLQLEEKRGERNLYKYLRVFDNPPS